MKEIQLDSEPKISEIRNQPGPVISNVRVPYRPVTVQYLGELVSKYQSLSGFEVACKLLVDEELLILKRDRSETPVTTGVQDA